MLCIWNDDTPLLIDEKQSFDRSQYVIVRKVFLRFKDYIKDEGEEFIRDWIRDTLKGASEIESVEVFHENDYNWAYVTYADSNDAYCAVQKAAKFDEIETALPADTWVQPTSFKHPEPDVQQLVDDLKTLETSIINDDSEVVGFAAIQELILLSTISEASTVKEVFDRVLPLVKIFELQITDAKGTVISLSEFRSILQCIGKHVSELAVKFRMDKYPKQVDRYYQKICQYAGPQLKTLTLGGVPAYHDWLIALKPLLGQIEYLSLQTSNYDFEYDIDFDLYCPNVQYLKIDMNLKGTFLSRSHHNLQKLRMLHNQYMDEKSVIEFMKNNPQLVSLEIEANDCKNLLKQIPLYLPKLNKLCLHQAYPNITADDLEHLTAMKQLTWLALICLDVEDADGILNCLPKFRQLEALKIHFFCDDPDDVYKPKFDCITALAQELAQLKRFHISNCQIDADMLSSFIGDGKNLEVFTIRECGLEITDTILETIETIRNAKGYAKMELRADKVHPELNREIKYSTVTLNSSD